jgi:hypothetical protein
MLKGLIARNDPVLDEFREQVRPARRAAPHGDSPHGDAPRGDAPRGDSPGDAGRGGAVPGGNRTALTLSGWWRASTL